MPASPNRAPLQTDPEGPSFHQDGTAPESAIFVFGSNLAGIHGAGAAKAARLQFGARPGVGRGLTGRAWAIATKGHPTGRGVRFDAPVLPLAAIGPQIEEFLEYARAHPEERFFVTRIGCGYAGYDDADIAPMFAGAPANCSFAREWRPFIEPATADRARER